MHPLPALHSKKTFLLSIIVLLSLSTLACGFLDGLIPSNPSGETVVNINQLPTLTPTPAGETSNNSPVATPAPLGDGGEPPTPSSSDPIVNSTTCPSLTASGEWGFENIQVYNNDFETLFYGELVNTSASPQQLSRVTGTFFDQQGQVAAGEESTSDYWSVEVVPAGARLPFELAIEGITTLADCTLRVESTSIETTLTQDFTFGDIYELEEGDDFYCIGGTMQNNGQPVSDFMVVIVTLYDAENQVINFNDYIPGLADGPPELFEVCVESYRQPIDRYEISAWGQ